MLPREITSLQHPIVKSLTRLRKSRKERCQREQALLTDDTLIEELAEYFALDLLLTSNREKRIKAKELFFVTPEILKKITGVESPETCAAVIAIPRPKAINCEANQLILDRISDPGNLGTLLRSARAFGFSEIVLTPETCDPFNDKALRAAKGSTFFLNITESSYADLEEPLVADRRGTPFTQVSAKRPIRLLLSHESQGLSKWASTCKTKISIPMLEGTESLNVASAGAILMHHFGETR